MDWFLALRKPREPQGPAAHVLIVGDGETALSYAAQLASTGALVALWRPMIRTSERQVSLRLRRLAQSDDCPVLVLGDVEADDWDLAMLVGEPEQMAQLVDDHVWLGNRIPAVLMQETEILSAGAWADRGALFAGHPGRVGFVNGTDIVAAGPFRLSAAIEHRDKSSLMALGLARRILCRGGIAVDDVRDLARWQRIQNALVSLWVAGALGAGGFSALLSDASRWATLCAAQREALALLRAQGAFPTYSQLRLVAGGERGPSRTMLALAVRSPLYRDALAAALALSEVTYRPVYADLVARLTQMAQRRSYVARLVA